MRKDFFLENDFFRKQGILTRQWPNVIVGAICWSSEAKIWRYCGGRSIMDFVTTTCEITGMIFWSLAVWNIGLCARNSAIPSFLAFCRSLKRFPVLNHISRKRKILILKKSAAKPYTTKSQTRSNCMLQYMTYMYTNNFWHWVDTSRVYVG